MVPKATVHEMRDIPTLILAAIAKKQGKGAAAYARGKVLVVLLDAGLGEWFPNQVAKQLPKIDFKEVWVVGLHGEVTDEYVYGVAQLDISSGNAPTCLVRIGKYFDVWEVKRYSKTRYSERRHNQQRRSGRNACRSGTARIIWAHPSMQTRSANRGQQAPAMAGACPARRF
jgi:hypothetical protein